MQKLCGYARRSHKQCFKFVTFLYLFPPILKVYLGKGKMEQKAKTGISPPLSQAEQGKNKQIGSVSGPLSYSAMFRERLLLFYKTEKEQALTLKSYSFLVFIFP